VTSNSKLYVGDDSDHHQDPGIFKKIFTIVGRDNSANFAASAALAEVCGLQVS